MKLDGPFLGDNQFAVYYEFETTFKPNGQRNRMSEMALYTVQDGKIVREQFFYNVPGKVELLLEVLAIGYWLLQAMSYALWAA
jgi:hypothetical protein